MSISITNFNKQLCRSPLLFKGDVALTCVRQFPGPQNRSTED